MKIAVTGVTSGVGRRFAEMALAQGHDVRGLVRQPDRDDAKALREIGVDTVRGDILAADTVRDLCAGADAAVHMAAHVGDWGPREQFDRINVGGTRVADAGRDLRRDEGRRETRLATADDSSGRRSAVCQTVRGALTAGHPTACSAAATSSNHRSNDRAHVFHLWRVKVAVIDGANG